MTALGNFPRLHSFYHGTALFTDVCTVAEPALSQIGLELRKAVCNAFLVHLQILLHLKGGKSGRVRQIAAGTGIQLYLSGGVLAASQFLADLSGGDLQGRVNGVEQRGLPHAGIAGHHADFSGKEF